MSDLLPSGFHQENMRVVRIPRYPNDPLRPESFDYYTIDIRWLLVIQDQIQLKQLEHIMSWYATLSNFLWKSKIALKVVTAHYKRRLSQQTGVTGNTLRDEHLPTSHEWVFWKGQVEWLEVAVRSLEKLISPMQSYNATRRIEMNYQAP